MSDNGKKEYPINGLEEDCTYRYCYIINTKGITKFVKKAMNKRFRKRKKEELRKQL